MTLPAYTGTLTPAHCQLIAAIRDQWAATVLSTAPVDRAATDEAVHRLYDAHKLPQPSQTIWMDSPLGCIYAAAVIGQLTEQLRERFLNLLRHRQLRDQMGGRLWARLAGQIRDQFGDQLGDRLRDPLSSQLEDQLSGQLEGQLSGKLWSQLRGQIKGKLQASSGISSTASLGTSSGTSSGARSGSSWGITSASRIRTVTGTGVRARTGLRTSARSFPGTTRTRSPSTLASCPSPAGRQILVSAP
jgi:hypothetical protein